MAPVGDVSFELERFEWTADDTLEVVGKWNGLRPGRRLTRPALTVEAGGRRHRVNGSADLDGEDWRATFEWNGSRGDVASAELELGRSLVVELPAPRRRRRRRGATAELDLRSALSDVTEERDRLREEVARLSAALAERPADAPALSSEVERLHAALAERQHDTAALRGEVERLQAALAERPDEDASDLRAEIERLRADADDTADLNEALTAAAAARADAEAARADAERLAAELSSVRSEAPPTEE